MSWVGSNFASCFCLSLVANKLSWNVWAVCVRWFVLNFVISVEEFQGGCILSSICDNMFSDKYNSRANPCNLFGMLQKTWNLFCETKLSLIFLGNTMLRCQKEGDMSSPQCPTGISDILISSKPNHWPSYKKKLEFTSTPLTRWKD